MHDDPQRIQLGPSTSSKLAHRLSSNHARGRPRYNPCMAVAIRSQDALPGVIVMGHGNRGVALAQSPDATKRAGTGENWKRGVCRASRVSTALGRQPSRDAPSNRRARPQLK